LQGGNLKEKNSRGVTQNSLTLQGSKDLLTHNIIWSPKFECILYRFIANKTFVIGTTLVHIIYYHICPMARNFLKIKAPSNSNLILFLSVKSQTLHLVWDAPQQPLPLWKEFSCLVPCGGLSYTDIFIYNTIYVLTSTNFISIIYNYIPSQYTQRASSIKHPILVLNNKVYCTTLIPFRVCLLYYHWWTITKLAIAKYYFFSLVLCLSNS
jgi:hypothetical protein